MAKLVDRSACQLFALTGHPATKIPCGLCPTGFSFGLQIVGHNRDNAGALAVAAEIESALPNFDALTQFGARSLARILPAALGAHV